MNIGTYGLRPLAGLSIRRLCHGIIHLMTTSPQEKQLVSAAVPQTFPSV
jgi:hypothetical protein